MPRRAESRGLNVADAASLRVRRVNFVGLGQPMRMQETEAFREGEGVKALRIQVYPFSRSLFSRSISAFTRSRAVPPVARRALTLASMAMAS